MEKCNGKAAIGGSEALISPAAAKILAAFGLVFLTGVLAVSAFFVEPLIEPYIPLRVIANSLMMVLLLFSLILSIKNIVTVLYTADDLPVLLPMPFSAGQIVTAKLAVSLKFPVILSFVLMNAVFLGFGLRAGMGAAYIIGTILSSFLIPVTGLAVAAFLTVVIFKVFGFIRNRDVMVVISGILTILLTIAYLIVSSLNNDDSADAALNTLSVVSDLSDAFPNISFMSVFMFEGSVLGLLISLGVTAAVIALALLAIKFFYLSTALSMQNTGTSKKAVKKSMLSNDKKLSSRKALFSYESKNTRRNPSYLIYGFAMTFIWPLFFCLPVFFGGSTKFTSMKSPLDTGAALFCSLLLGITASCFACGFNILAGTAFSREGGSFSMLRSMPVDFNDYYKSKRNFAMLICSLGSVAYIIIIGIVCVVFGIVSIADSWVILFGALVCFFVNSVLVNLMLMDNAKKPVFNWDSETEISRKLSFINGAAIIIGFVFYIALFVVIIVSSVMNLSALSISGLTVTSIAVVISALLALIIFVTAIAFNKYSVKNAEKYLMNFE